MTENARDYDPSAQEEVLSDSESGTLWFRGLSSLPSLVNCKEEMKYLGFYYTASLREMSLKRADSDKQKVTWACLVSRQWICLLIHDKKMALCNRQ